MHEAAFEDFQRNICVIATRKINRTRPAVWAIVVFDLYLRPCDWQRPSLLKFFRSWRVQWEKATHQCQRIQPSQNSKKQYEHVQYSQILIHRGNVSAACDWWLGLLNSKTCNYPLHVTDDHSSSNLGSTSRAFDMLLDNYNFWMLLFNHQANNRFVFKAVWSRLDIKSPLDLCLPAFMIWRASHELTKISPE